MFNIKKKSDTISDTINWHFMAFLSTFSPNECTKTVRKKTVFNKVISLETPYLQDFQGFGGRGWIRTTEGIADRFTV